MRNDTRFACALKPVLRVMLLATMLLLAAG